MRLCIDIVLAIDLAIQISNFGGLTQCTTSPQAEPIYIYIYATCESGRKKTQESFFLYLGILSSQLARLLFLLLFNLSNLVDTSRMSSSLELRREESVDHLQCDSHPDSAAAKGYHIGIVVLMVFGGLVLISLII